MQYAIGEHIKITGYELSHLPKEFVGQSAIIMALPETIGVSYKIRLDNDWWYIHPADILKEMNRNGANE